MTNTHGQLQERSSRLGAILEVGCLLLIGSGAAYRSWLSHPVRLPISVAAVPPTAVSALGRLEPEGEVIQVFAPTSLEGARVETLRVNHGQWICQGDVIAILDTYTRRQATLQEARERVRVAQAQLRQAEAGAKLGQIRAQARVVDRQQVELQTETTAQKSTIARLEAELRNAELEDQRHQSLYAEGAVSASLRDRKQLATDTVQQQLNEARANLSRIQLLRQQQISEAKATLEQIAEVRPVDVGVARSQVISTFCVWRIFVKKD
ncbi:MAG: biotin/lipoyl-binding protein [Scytolyngbya sp. HA4215-MV1]|nr:biotin/lipoyl-binding protein [Scytolyngbya sp. HA4215-MV1]